MQMITIIILPALLLCPKCSSRTPSPHRLQTGSCLSVLLLDAQWLGFPSTASSISGTSRSSSVIRGRHFYRQVGGAQSEWFTAVSAAAAAGGGGGGCTVVAAALASSVHSSRRRERKRSTCGDRREEWQTVHPECYLQPQKKVPCGWQWM